ncbi:MAG TPA: hypothetical protein RMF84_00530 [Polyangiaceae bacterium LLY-WYZ-14_1]|nr:hypothetical protein [Polyangiaceae bacterium LLY-WYZ-14_1]
MHRPYPRRPPALFALLTGLALLGGTVVAAGTAIPNAAEGQRRLRARVYMTQHRIPGNLSERGLIRFVRGHNARTLRETGDEKLEDRKWIAEMVVAFNAPIDDTEFQVLFYDIHDGSRRFVESLPTYVNSRDEKTFLRRVILDRPKFKPNRRMELVVTVRRQEVGKHRFALEGEEVRHSGEVNFDDDET